MKILTIQGSPRLKGNTAEVLSLFEEQVGHDVERTDIVKHDVKPCISCYKCQERLDEPGCVHKDDAQAIFEKMIEADAIVFASPLYFWGFSAQLKALMDRQFCLLKNIGQPDAFTLLGKKKIAFLITCGGVLEGNCDAIKSTFENFAEYCKLDPKGVFILPHCITPDAIGTAGENLATELAKAITS